MTWLPKVAAEDCPFCERITRSEHDRVINLHLVPRRLGDGLMLPWTRQERTIT